MSRCGVQSTQLYELGREPVRNFRLEQHSGELAEPRVSTDTYYRN